MKITYCGTFDHHWNTERHVEHALTELGHTVTRVNERGARWDAIGRANADLVLWTHSQRGDPSTQLAALDRLRQRGIPTVSFHLDRWWGLARESDIATDPFFRTDLVATADGGHADRWQAAGVRHLWLPPGVHGPEVGRGTYRPEYASDVAFVGGHPYPHPEWRDERARLIGFLQERYGERFRLWPADRRHPIRGRDLNDLFASVKVVVGDSCLAGGAGWYWSDRVALTLGMGGLLVHPHVEGMDDWYTNREHLFTFDLGDMVGLGLLVDDLLADESLRRRTVDNALALVASRDTYTHRMAELLEAAGAAPVRRGWLDGRAGRHTVRHSSGVTATMDLRPSTSDSVAVREVWQQESYRVGRADVAGGLVVDVGAHVGSFSILAAKLGAARVLATEPIAENRAACEANLALNGVAEVVELWPFAICDDSVENEVAMAVDGSGSHLTDEGRRVPALSLVEWLAMMGAGDAEIAFLKNDNEGGEYQSLRSLAAVLLRVQAMAMEAHGPRMSHLAHLRVEQFGELVTVLAEYGTMDIQARPSTGGMIYWRRHQ